MLSDSIQPNVHGSLCIVKILTRAYREKEDVGAVAMAAAPAHVLQIRALYKKILVLHRFMPLHLRALGDQYVKEEFRRHKSASPEQVQHFMKEWEVKRHSMISVATRWRYRPQEQHAKLYPFLIIHLT